MNYMNMMKEDGPVSKKRKITINKQGIVKANYTNAEAEKQRKKFVFSARAPARPFKKEDIAKARETDEAKEKKKFADTVKTALASRAWAAINQYGQMQRIGKGSDGATGASIEGHREQVRAEQAAMASATATIPPPVIF